MPPHQGTLYIISAPSGAGKTSLVKALVSQIDNLVISVSHTTRPARCNEENGVNYHFVTDERFQDLLNKGIFLEHAKVFGHYYGTSREWVQNTLMQQDVILEIDWQGAQQIKNLFKDSISIFILPPSMQILRKRLNDRAQDSGNVIEKRMQQARAEISHYKEFDYLIINDDFDKAVANLAAIITAQRLSYGYQADRIHNLLRQLLQQE